MSQDTYSGGKTPTPSGSSTPNRGAAPTRRPAPQKSATQPARGTAPRKAPTKSGVGGVNGAAPVRRSAPTKATPPVKGAAPQKGKLPAGTKPATKGAAPKGKKKKKKKKNKVLSVIGKIFISIFVLITLLASVFVGFYFGIQDNTVDVLIEEANLDHTSIIYYQDGVDEKGAPKWSTFELESTVNRVWVDLDKTPPHLANAFIAIEDERFRDHSGVDLKRTFGAFINWVQGKDSYGGSTITQQLIKNVTGDNDRSPTRKIQEIVRAIKLEEKMSKDQIIEMYMNTIYFGSGCYGVQTASNYYFSKDVSELTLEQCASLAGIVKAPSTYNPATNYENNKERQEVVLNKMAENGLITQEECEVAKAKDLNLKVGNVEDDKKAQKIQPYFVDAVIDDVIADLMVKENLTRTEATNRLYTGGFKIYCTVDKKVQDAIDKVYSNPANFPGGSGNKAQSAIVVMDPYTGYVKGLSGGVGEKTENRSFNRATQAKRQPGSAIKPLAVYGPGIEYNVITAATIVNDAPLKIGDWEPKNSGGGYGGRKTVRNHLEKSRNIPAVKIMQELGVDRSFDFMSKNLGFTTLVEGETRNGRYVTDKNLSMALGGVTDGVTVEEMTAAYCTFVNQGKYNKPKLYSKVEDNRGNVILENVPENSYAMSEQTAYIMQNMMQGVVTNGTGTAARLSGIPSGGKTGTTNSNVDRWFVGFTPNYVAGVWTGYDTPKAMSGSNTCLTIWKSVMDDIHKGETVKQFKEPSGLKQANVCISCGRVATSGSSARKDFFKEGTAPQKRCSCGGWSRVPSSSGNGDNNTTTTPNRNNTPSNGGGTNANTGGGGSTGGGSNGGGTSSGGGGGEE